MSKVSVKNQLKKLPNKPGVYLFYNGAPRSNLRGIKRNPPKPPALLRQGYGRFSAPRLLRRSGYEGRAFPQETAKHSATEDKSGQILYVGRATSLKQRVSSYFPASLRRGSTNKIGRQKLLDPRLQEMVGLIKKIKIRPTDTLLEAIILEANLIKKYWPKYNIKDRDNRSFLYLVIPKKDWTYPMIVRERDLERFPVSRADIFGPYQSLMLVKKFLRLVRRVFPYSTCLPAIASTQAMQAGQPLSGKPCFNYQIGLCPGACVGKLTPADYQKNIKNLILLLRGQKKLLLKKLTKANPAQALALKHLQDVALLSQEPERASAWQRLNVRIEGYDISHLSGQETVGSMVVFVDGQPDKTQYRLFKIKQAPANDDLRALEEVLMRRFKHSEWRWPDFILIDGGRPQIDYASKVLANLHQNFPLVGISKFGGDKFVFPKGLKKLQQQIILTSKGIFLRVREEAHRFALSFSRRRRKII